MPLHQIILEVSVPADKEVSADMLVNLLNNQLWLNPVKEAHRDNGDGGLIHWNQVRVRSLGTR